MKKIRLVTFILFGLFIAVVSCIFTGPSIRGEGEVTKEKRMLSAFEKVAVSRGLEVYLVADSVEYVVVEADENLQEVITTEMEDETLEISTSHFIRSARSKKVHVHYKHLNGIKSGTGSTFRSEGTVRSKKLVISASTGSFQDLDVHAGTLEARCSSGAQIRLSGIAREARLMAATGAHLEGKEFSGDDCYTKASSGGHIRTGVKRILEAEASSGGHIYFSGNPESRKLDSSSGGQIHEE